MKWLYKITQLNKKDLEKGSYKNEAIQTQNKRKNKEKEKKEKCQ